MTYLVEITGVIQGSPAYRAGICKGEFLVSMNQHKVRDVLDYMYYAAETDVHLIIENQGQQREIRIRKDEYDDLGLEFASFLMDNKQSCKINACSASLTRCLPECVKRFILKMMMPVCRFCRGIMSRSRI